jgi:Pyridoxamine 5'-phosphate oxidase
MRESVAREMIARSYCGRLGTVGPDGSCFEIDEPGAVFAYGRFECDTSLAYRSVVAFGRIRIVEDQPSKHAFFTGLMNKYGDPRWGRPPEFFPRLDQVCAGAHFGADPPTCSRALRAVSWASRVNR